MQDLGYGLHDNAGGGERELEVSLSDTVERGRSISSAAGELFHVLSTRAQARRRTPPLLLGDSRADASPITRFTTNSHTELEQAAAWEGVVLAVIITDRLDAHADQRGPNSLYFATLRRTVFDDVIMCSSQP